jgi:hypothetical protein
MYICDYGNMTYSNSTPQWNGCRVPMQIWKRAYKIYRSDLHARMMYVDRVMYHLKTLEPDPIATFNILPENNKINL